MVRLDDEFRRRVRRLVPGVVGLVLLGWLLDRYAFGNCPLSHWRLVSFVGGLFLLLGFVLAAVSGRQLTLYGRHDRSLPRGTTDRLVSRGLFCWVRHPAFTGFALILVGGGLVSKSCGFTFVSAPIGLVYLILFTYLVEEPQLLRRFGDAYSQYKKEVPAFLPLPWRHCRRSTFAKGGNGHA